MLDILSVNNMRESDAHTISNKIPSKELMFRAGKGIYLYVYQKAPVLIVCGRGNNAGDGFVVAELLKENKLPCEIVLLSDNFSDDGKFYFEKCEGIKVHHSMPTDLSRFNCILDCIFGTGFHGEIREPYASAIKQINESGIYTVSADINSGLNGDSGLAGISNEKPLCVKSDLTVSIGSYKAGHYLGSSFDVIKEKVNVDIGITPIQKPFHLIEKADVSPFFNGRKRNSNKGDFGYVALIGGSLEYSGAAKLANLSLSALRSGAGVAKLAVPNYISNAVLPYLLESTLFPLDNDENGHFVFSEERIKALTNRTKAVAVGMGMGKSDEVKKLLLWLLENYDGRLIIDADGLNTLSECDMDFPPKKCRLILTPHPKEFERLCKIPIGEFSENPIKYATEYANKTESIVLLKGSSTVITDGNEVYITDRGTVGMSTAGSGDVLSGVILGMCGYIPEDKLTLGVAAAAYVAGLAGEIANESIPEASMISGDTVKCIPKAIKRMVE